MTPPTKFLGTPYLQDPDLTIYNGDVREVLRELPDESVQMCVTSPPYWGLRDYGTGAWEGGDADCDHKTRREYGRAGKSFEDYGAEAGYARGSNFANHKALDEAETFRDSCGKCGASRVDNQLGLEPTPEAYVEKMVEVFREVRRVLRKDGTLWLNLGDSYAGAPAGNFGPDMPRPADGGAYRENKPKLDLVRAGLKPKDLVLMPARVALALQADGWYLRSEITWCKPNPMPESVTDRPTQATEKVYLFSRSPRYFYDAEAVREPHTAGNLQKQFTQPKERGDARSMRFAVTQRYLNPAGRNLRNWWEIATEPYPEAHFATYPQELVRRCILAGSSERGCCPECGAPWVREMEYGESSWEARKEAGHKTSGYHADDGAVASFENPDLSRAPAGAIKGGLGWVAPRSTTGWKRSCDHDWQLAIEPCTILDPFFGSGTTGLVARKHGRKTIGIELSPEYCALAARRLSQLSLLAEGAA